TLIFVVGLLDDIYHLQPGVKLLGQLIAVSLVILLGLEYRFSSLHWLDILVSYLWFVGIINAVNLLDNMDGVSSGIVIIGSIGVCLMGIFGDYESIPQSVYVGGVLCFSVFGFWLLNKPPARIFMGDSGSLLIGFVFAAISVPSELNGYLIPAEAESISDNILRLFASITLAAIPILDTSLVTVTRLMRGQSPSVGGKDHSTHRLAESGLTHWQTLKILYLVSAVCVSVAVFMTLYPGFGYLIFAIVFIGMLMIAVYLASVRIQVAPIKKEGWQQLVTSITYRVPLLKMVVDVVLIGASFYLSYLLRFDFRPDESLTLAMLEAIPVVVMCCLAVNFLFRIYEFSWRSAVFQDVFNFATVACVGTILSIATATLFSSFGIGYSRGAYVIFGIVYFIALCGSRFSFRFMDEILLRLRMQQSPDGQIPLLIYGTTKETKFFLDEVLSDKEIWGKYKVKGIVRSLELGIQNAPRGIQIKSSEEWLNEWQGSRPEIILVDDDVPNQVVQEFGEKFGDHPRIRRYTRKLIDIS
ncbi:MAG: hypothetical protein MI748_17855, partial [Opitutales bacterium]|nr:hypothetical protein [Opitutales bacterium]